MFMRIFNLCAVAFLAAPAFAQGPAGPMFPPSEKSSDLGEVEDVPEDSEFLPPLEEEEGGDQGTRTGDIRVRQAAELSYSPEELRTRHTNFASLGLGMVKPWQSYSVEWGYLVRSNFAVSTFAGGGEFRESGVIDDRSYDVTIKSRGIGLASRYFFSRLEKLSIQTIIGYAAWDGSIEPQGAAAEGDFADKLAASFKTHGMFAGISAGFTWLWDSGTYILWTPVGARSSKIVAQDLTRDSDLVGKAVSRTVERGEFYGLTNIEVGYMF